MLSESNASHKNACFDARFFPFSSGLLGELYFGRTLFEQLLLTIPSHSCHVNSILYYKSSRPEVFLRKGALKICCKFIEEHPCQSLVSIKLLCNFIKITLRHGYFPVNLQHIFRTPFFKNTSGRLLLYTTILYEITWSILPDRLVGKNGVCSQSFQLLEKQFIRGFWFS